MGKSRSVEVGTENTNTDGYTYVKTEAGWKLKHRIIAEAKLGRPLKQGERVYFVNGDRANLDPDNIGVAIKGNGSKVRRLELLSTKLIEIMDEIKELKEDIARDARAAAKS